MAFLVNENTTGSAYWALTSPQFYFANGFIANTVFTSPTVTFEAARISGYSGTMRVSIRQSHSVYPYLIPYGPDLLYTDIDIVTSVPTSLGTVSVDLPSGIILPPGVYTVVFSKSSGSVTGSFRLGSLDPALPSDPDVGNQSQAGGVDTDWYSLESLGLAGMLKFQVFGEYGLPLTESISIPTNIGENLRLRQKSVDTVHPDIPAKYMSGIGGMIFGGSYFGSGQAFVTSELEMNNITASTTIESVTLVTNTTISVNNISVGTSLTSPDVNTALPTENLLVGTDLESVTITTKVTLDVDDITVNNGLEEIYLQMAGALSVNSISVLNSITSPTVVQNTTLSVDNIQIDTTTSTVTVVMDTELSINDISVDITVETLIISADLVIDDIIVETDVQSLIWPEFNYSPVAIGNNALGTVEVETGRLVEKSSPAGQLVSVSTIIIDEGGVSVLVPEYDDGVIVAERYELSKQKLSQVALKKGTL